MRLDGTPNRQNHRQWRTKESKKPLKKSRKRKHPPKHDFGFAVNAEGGISDLYFHSKRRKLKKGAKKGQITFDHKKMNQEGMKDVCEAIIVPFMKRTKSKVLVFDCTTVYHNPTIYALLRDEGIEPYPSGGRPFDVEGGYPPNSHDCMPNELINDKLKENARVSFQKLRKSRRTMTALQTVIKSEAKKLDKEFIRDRIRDLPKILKTIEKNNGGRTKY